MKPVIYQLALRYFGNTGGANRIDGDIHQNGCGKFADVNERALAALVELGVTHVWLLGVPRQATLTDYSDIGLPADPPEIVKGRAGSFYAVRDYADVCPDYALDPRRRMEEFEALVQRIHALGLRVLIDLVPNHVSRNYSSEVANFDLGRADDQSKFFAAANNFYYLVDPPGRALSLPTPAHWHPRGVQFSGRFAREDGSPGHTPKATGGDDYGRIVDTNLTENVWYETIKLNYGYNFTDQKGHYEPIPRTWTMVDAILAFWQRKGVDGFRCDFAHYVPREAWAHLLSRARARNPATFFLAEAYPYEGGLDPVHSERQLLEAGFDAVYHWRAYNALKALYQGGGADAYEREMAALDDAERPRYLEYLENHDERRVASPIVRGVGSGDSGFGSSAAGYQLAPLQLLYSQGPVLLFNGQEVGEPGAGATGFKGDNGRTTIFDYWRMPVFARWVNAHAYDGGQLEAHELALRRFYADLLQLCQHPSIAGSSYWGLRYCNRAGNAAGASDGLYPYARFAPGSGRLMVVVANLRPGSAEHAQVRVPREVTKACEIADGRLLQVRLVLNQQGKQAGPSERLSVEELAMNGFRAAVSEQACNVYELGSTSVSET
jgi:glycosidase